MKLIGQIALGIVFAIALIFVGSALVAGAMDYKFCRAKATPDSAAWHDCIDQRNKP